MKTGYFELGDEYDVTVTSYFGHVSQYGTLHI